MNKFLVSYVFILVMTSCVTVKDLKDEKLQTVFVCSSLPDNSLHNYRAEQCKNFLLNLKSYEVEKFYAEGGFALILTSAEYHEPKFSYKLIDKFISFGADINYLNNAQASQGANALMIAILFQQPNMVKYLLNKGADICLKSVKGRTAMDYLIPKNKRVLTPRTQKKIDEILPMLQVAMEKRNNCV